MEEFLLKSAISLTVFYLIYRFILEREKMHVFNRFFLLLSLLFSMLIPFVSIEIYREIEMEQIQNTVVPEHFLTVDSPIVIKGTSSKIPVLLWSFYAIVTLILAFRLIKNLNQIRKRIQSNRKENLGKTTLVLVPEKILPHTFLNYIFINQEDYKDHLVEEELYAHELTHAHQKHTLDILLIELMKTLFWFNPILILYKKAIQLNHEFLADEKVVTSYNNVPFYQNLLLHKTNGFQTIYLASNLNYSITKKRLIMMTKTTSKKIAFLKKIAVVPILAGLIYFFCIEIVAQKKTVGTITTTEKNIPSDDKTRDEYYKGVWVKIFDSRINKRISSQYENLTLEEKRQYLDYVPKAYQKKSPSQKEYSDFKDSKKYAIWINGKHVSNKELYKYSSNDFVYYLGSSVSKNARSKMFPQPFQFTLYTDDYFEKNLKNSHLKFSGDTVKIGFSDYKKALKQQTKTTKADTLVWVEEAKDEKVGSNYFNEKGTFDAKGILQKSGYIKINNKTYFYVTNEENVIEYYTRWGNKVNKNGEPIKD